MNFNIRKEDCLLGKYLRNIVIVIVIGSQIIIGKPINQYHKLIDRHKHKKIKINNSNILLHSNGAKRKLAQFKQQCAEIESLKKYEIEKRQEMKIQKERELKEQQLKIAEQNINNISKKDNNTISLSRGSNSEEITVRLSYYTNSYSSCGKTDAISASGKNLNDGGNYVAAPSNIPFGTQIMINGQTFIVVDRGGAIGYTDGVMMLDVYVPNTSEKNLSTMGVKITKAQIIR